MINLTLFADFNDTAFPSVVVRLSRAPGQDNAALVGEIGDELVFQYGELTFSLKQPLGQELLGDVVLLEPNLSRVSRWIRGDSEHNTLLVTERCDQLCIMCSQPPKKSHIDMFVYMKKACLLAPKNILIGFSGGEPLLFKAQLFDLLEEVHLLRPDLKFHILTNAQHFTDSDIERLRGRAFKDVLWGVPLYASDPATHDQIVGKIGAFELLMTTLPRMALAGLQIELRTVILQQNYDQLADLGRFIVHKLPFISVWALMQLEKIGFAKNGWSKQFVDHSSNLEPLETSIAFGLSRGLDVTLYNIPFCTVSAELRPYLNRSISDWKRAFPHECNGCSAKSVCTGFFEWHSTLDDYTLGGAL